MTIEQDQLATYARNEIRKRDAEIERLNAAIGLLEVQQNEDLAAKGEVIDRLRAAGERVVWFDWSGNDPDAVAAVYALRQELVASRVEQEEP